jgi:hypothetical protein
MKWTPVLWKPHKVFVTDSANANEPLCHHRVVCCGGADGKASDNKAWKKGAGIW